MYCLNLFFHIKWEETNHYGGVQTDTGHTVAAVERLFGHCLNSLWRRAACARRRASVRLALTSSAMELQIWQCDSCRQFSRLETNGLKPPPSCRLPGLLKTIKTRANLPGSDRSVSATTAETKWRWCSVRSGETRAKGRSSICWRLKRTLSVDVR